MISAVILTKNEEKNIVDCIEGLSFCDEIIVIDDVSTDRTVDVAKKAGAKVYVHSLENNFSMQRNFGLAKAQQDWVLFIDADERITPELRSEILFKTEKNTQTEGFYIKRVDFMRGKKLLYGETGDIKFLRLARNGKGIWEGKVHEVWDIKGKKETITSPLLHYPHSSINEFLSEINVYTDIRANELYKKGVRVHWYDMIIYPKAKFLQNYIVKRGFLDGLEGFIFALMMSFHSFLVRGKLWQLWDQKKHT